MVSGLNGSESAGWIWIRFFFCISFLLFIALLSFTMFLGTAMARDFGDFGK